MSTADNELTTYDDNDYLHVGAILLDYLRFFFRRWYFLLALIAIFASALLFYSIKTYTPYYSASVYYTVELTGDVTTDAIVAERISYGIPSVASTSEFTKDLEKAMGDEYLPISYSINATPAESANMLILSVLSTDPDYVNKLLTGIEKIFPEWIRKAFSCTVTINTLEKLSNGIPDNSFSRVKTAIYGGLAGVLLWFLIASYFIFSVRRIHGEEDLYQLVNVPCFGSLPDITIINKKKRRNRSVILSNQNVDASYLRAINSVRSRIDRKLLTKGKKILLVTSTKPNEGKSTFSMNLALSMRNTGKKVVFIDGDLRGNKTSILTEKKENQVGLSDFLMSKVNHLTEFSHKEDNLLIVSAGCSCDEFWDSPNFQRLDILLTAMKAWADIIIIDSPPVENFGDALLMSVSADAVLYVIRGDYAEIKDIRKGVEPFYKINKIKGFVLNRIDLRTSVYGYKYGYGYGYGGKYAKYSKYDHGDE